MNKVLLAALALAFSSSSANAQRRAHRRPPPKSKRVVAKPVHVRVAIGAWSPHYRPVARTGYVWVIGHHRRGAWVPGYWRPLAPPPRPGLVFVFGHWNGDHYVDGYYRADERAGYVWVDGYYDEYGDWVDGYWQSDEVDEWDTEVTGDVQMIIINDTDDDVDQDIRSDESSQDAPREVHALPPIYD